MSRHFVLSTDGDASEASQISNDLERMFAAIGDVGLASTDAPALRIDVVHFRRRDDYLKFGPPDSAAVFQRSRLHDFERRPLILAQGDLVKRTREYVQHELTHWFIHHHFPQAPGWLHEGLAQYLSTLDVSDGRATLGHRPSEFAFWKGPWRLSRDPTGKTALVPVSEAPTVAQLLAAGHEMFASNSEADDDPEAQLVKARQNAAYYAGAWTLVHLFISDPRYKDRFNDYLQAMLGSSDARQAWAGTLGRLPPAQMEEDYHRVLAPREIPLLRTAYTPPSVPPPAGRALRDGQVHLLWAGLRQWDSPAARASAKADLQEAAQDLRGDPMLAIMNARMASEEGNSAEAERLLSQALTEAPTNRQLLNALGWTRIFGTPARETAAPKLVAALAPVAAALTPVAQSAAEFDLLAHYSLLTKDWDGGIAFELKAVHADHSCYQCLRTAAFLFSEKGQLDDAIVIAQKALSALPEGVSSTALVADLARYRRRLADAAPPTDNAAARSPQERGR
ncbi:MAG: hypothetical protein QOI66_1728 [Myxococcales bacterium]|nr:hypothetical protein [Myxococcales bacterium]